MSISCLSTGTTRIILVTAPELQEDWIGTKVIGYCSLGLFPNSSIWCHKGDPGHGIRIARGLARYKSYQLLFIRSISKFLNLVPQELILVTAPELQEDLLGRKMKKVLLVFMYIYNLSLHWCPKRCHGTRIARGVPLPVYMNLDVYRGFWCTSCCVVF